MLKEYNKNQKRIQRKFVIAGQYFGSVQQNLSRRELGHIFVTFERPTQESIL